MGIASRDLLQAADLAQIWWLSRFRAFSSPNVTREATGEAG